MTTSRPTVLCPIDFSAASRSALRYAAAIADHFGARLTLLFVDHPLLAQVPTSAQSVPSLADRTKQELRKFCDETLADTAAGAKLVEFRHAFGKPAPEILRETQEEKADLIVMSSRGNSGVRKMFFGSTTERVLRNTTVPVLVTPDDQNRAISVSEIARHINRVVAPVDLSEASSHQVTIASGIAKALSVPLILAHALEPIFTPISVQFLLPGADATRRARADESLSVLTNSISAPIETESLVLDGEPSEEIVKLADTRHANLIVMGLHSSTFLGPRMGSVTYRVLCLTRAAVLALPPKPPQ